VGSLTGKTQTGGRSLFFVSEGSAHKDMIWRHIGRAPPNDGRSPDCVVLMDLVSRAPAPTWGGSCNNVVELLGISWLVSR
jgi:hypothetical protein